jgi:hypothetical protein
MRRKVISFVLLLGSFVWSLVVLVPFLHVNANAFKTMWQSICIMVSAIFCWFLIMGFGFAIYDRFPSSDSKMAGGRCILKRFLIAVGIGLGLFAAIILVVGLTIGVGRKAILVTLVILTLLVGKRWLKLFQEIGCFFEQLRRRTWSFYEVVLILSILVIALIQLPAALTPTLYPDTLRYHFGLTKLFEQAGRITFLPYYAEANISSNWQMVYLPQIIWAHEGVAQVFNWCCLLLTSAALFVALEGISGLIAALVLVSTPILLGVAGLGNNDLGVTFFSALMWVALSNRTLKSFSLLAGLFGGFAVGTKYTAGISIVATVLSCALLMRTNRHDSSKAENFKLFDFFCGAFLGYLPWLFRNLLWTGDPFYPVLSTWLPWGSEEGRWVSQRCVQEISHYGQDLSLWKRIAYAPFQASVAEARYYDGDLGILFWSILPWTIFINFKSKNLLLRSSTLAVIFGFIIWAAGAQLTRYLAPMIPAACLMAGMTWKEWDKQFRPSKRMKVIVMSSIAFLISINVWQTFTAVSGFSDPYQFLSQGMSRSEYMIQRSQIHRISQFLFTKDASSKVLLIGEDGVAAFKNPVEIVGPLDKKWFVAELSDSKSPIEFSKRLAARNIRYLCLNRSRMDYLEKRFGYMSWPSLEIRNRLDDFLKKEADLIYKNGEIELYQLRLSS